MKPVRRTDNSQNHMNKGLGELALDISYRTDTTDLVSDFYIPCLSKSVLYRRAVGYFTSSSLSIAAQGVAALLSKGGQIKLIASPCLLEDDIEAIKAGYEQRDSIIRQAASRTFRDIHDKIVTGRLDALSWLIAQGLLQVKLAIRIDEPGNHASGIYHEKLGIFTDEHDNHVAFSGSSNETAGGFVNNFESIDNPLNL